jgi:hypothetical protein
MRAALDSMMKDPTLVPSGAPPPRPGVTLRAPDLERVRAAAKKVSGARGPEPAAVPALEMALALLAPSV